MLTIKSTKLLTGVEICGDYEDLNTLYDALSNVIGEEGFYEGYESCSLRVLGLCYEIRHAYQDERSTLKSDDGSRYHSFNCFWPEMIFIASALGDFMSFAENKGCYLNDSTVEFFNQETRQRLKEALPNHIALLRYFQSLIWNELKSIIGQKRFTKIFGVDESRLRFNLFEQSFDGYCTQMINILNVKYIGWKPERRESYLANVAEKVVKPNYEYNNLKDAVMEYTDESGTTYFEIELEGMQYPDGIKW